MKLRRFKIALHILIFDLGIQAVPCEHFTVLTSQISILSLTHLTNTEKPHLGEVNLRTEREREPGLGSGEGGKGLTLLNQSLLAF